MVSPAERSGGGLRADAQHNYAVILDAARRVFLERGPGAALEDVARRAGVGIGTLYRRFPDRGALLRALVLDALRHSYESAERARSGAEVGLDAVEQYMRDVLELQVSAIIPMALGRIDLGDPEVAEARRLSAESVETLIAGAHEDGSLAAAVTFADLGTLLVRLARPLPGGVPADLDARLADRHLRLVLAGLRSGGSDVLGPDGPSMADVREHGPGA